MPLLLGFDQLSSLFCAILFVALLLCFAFLGEYFEYDSGAFDIMLLSALFSQLAFMFFCVRDILLLLVFWELISVVSFFLIKFWTMRSSTVKAALKVFVISQLGDFFFVIGLVSIVSVTGSTDMQWVLSVAKLYAFSHISDSVAVPIAAVWSISLLSALFLKSAQVVFYPWLLDAMEAPVPISAQLHSSTLVIIGFYVFFRFSEVIFLWSWSSTVLILAGSLTAVGASILGFFQIDGKRLLACSTASQLGYVVIALGLGLVEEAAALLSFCCCNKAYTFVWFGSLMERSGGVSDFRKLPFSQTLLVERAGLITSALNTTVAPGAFAWHVKSLLARGSLSSSSALDVFGSEVLAIS